MQAPLEQPWPIGQVALDAHAAWQVPPRHSRDAPQSPSAWQEKPAPLQQTPCRQHPTEQSLSAEQGAPSAANTSTWTEYYPSQR